MAIITSAEVKALLSISVSTYDTLIATLIPIAQDKVVRFTNNAFLDISTQINASTIAFVSGAPATITDSDAQFVVEEFQSGQDVLVYGSDSNDGIYNVATAAAGTLTLATGETLTTEAAGDDITITRVRWPRDIKAGVATLINFLMTQQGKRVTSESLPGGASFQYKNERELLMELFVDYRKPYR
jgi:hypothetical protein